MILAILLFPRSCTYEQSIHNQHIITVLISNFEIQIEYLEIQSLRKDFTFQTPFDDQFLISDQVDLIVSPNQELKNQNVAIEAYIQTIKELNDDHHYQALTLYLREEQQSLPSWNEMQTMVLTAVGEIH